MRKELKREAVLVDNIRGTLTAVQIDYLIRHLKEQIGKDEVTFDLRIWKPEHHETALATISFDESFGTTLEVTDHHAVIEWNEVES